MASSGALAGKPYSVDVGTNNFEVRATDSSGLSCSATMTLLVAVAPAKVSTWSVQPTNLLLSWTGGIAPYDVLMATNLISPTWQLVMSALSTQNMTVSATNPSALYRIQ